MFSCIQLYSWVLVSRGVSRSRYNALLLSFCFTCFRLLPCHIDCNIHQHPNPPLALPYLNNSEHKHCRRPTVSPFRCTTASRCKREAIGQTFQTAILCKKQVCMYIYIYVYVFLYYIIVYIYIMAISWSFT